MTSGWTRRPGDRVIRTPRQQELQPVFVPAPLRPTQRRRFESPLILVYGFGSLIAIGTFLLWLPIFNTTGHFAPFLTALFTATSAACVTGLTVVNTGAFWNQGGQAVILGLILVGGLGFMSTATFLLVIVAQRMSLPSQLLVTRGFLDASQFGGLVRLTLQIIALAFVIQALAFVVLFWRMEPMFGSVEGAWQALFHAVSAYNNAGFDIQPEGASSLSLFRGDVFLLAGIGLAAVAGSLGYTFFVDVLKVRRFNRFSLDSRLVIVTTFPLLLIGGLVFFAFEYNNPGTLGQETVWVKGVNSLFHSITPRTVGFSTVDIGMANLHTVVIIMALMFIGGSSGSTAGGIKVNTFAVILAAVCASVRNRPYVEVFRREIPAPQVQRALAVAFLAIAFVSIISFLLVITEPFPFDRILFEVVSAFGTVGLSTGITPDLSVIGKTLIVITMFVGRIGPLTIALALGQGQRHALYRYSQERVRIG
ncbi:MAG: Trk family potassium uptake protein [Chloroflexi bacterium]|nr:Trk family potassium uptake protein [Chloroflexota bacterium]